MDTEITGDSVPDETLTPHAKFARDHWNAKSDDYQAFQKPALAQEPEAWGMLRTPEADLQVLSNVADLDVLDFGCGAAQWSIALALRGARPVGLDLSEQQLAHARAAMAGAGVEFPLVQGSGEHAPLPSASFDIVFSDGGVMSWCDPYLTVPETARLLRPGGLLAFCAVTAFAHAHWNDDDLWPGKHLESAYFGSARPKPNGATYFAMPHGAWIDLFNQHGFEIEQLLELQPPSGVTNPYSANLEWASKWPLEEIWKVRLRD